jgi:hypothetical protein
MFIPIPDTNFFHPGSRVKKIPGSGSKNLSILSQKLFLSFRKYDPECSSRIRIQILIFYPSRILDPGSGSATLFCLTLTKFPTNEYVVYYITRIRNSTTCYFFKRDLDPDPDLGRIKFRVRNLQINSAAVFCNAYSFHVPLNSKVFYSGHIFILSHTTTVSPLFRYNKRFGSDGLHEPLTWEKQQDAVDRFKGHFHEIYNSVYITFPYIFIAVMV